MTKKEPLDLVTDIEQSSEEYEHAVFGTYTYDPVFFESKILPILQKRDAENILVFVDRTEYDSNFSQIKLAGKEYYLDHCNSGKVFHPKFSLLTWEEGGKLVIGSANLNENGWRTAGEIVVNIDYDVNNPNKDIESAFYEMSQFLKNLVNLNFLKSKKHRQKLMEIVTQTKWLANINGTVLSEKIRILNNIQTPILDQILQLINGEEVNQVTIMSPFFGDSEILIEKFIKLGCKKIRIFLQPEKVIGFSSKNIESLKKNGVEIEVLSSRFKECESRYNHAKVIIVKTKKNAYCLTGSPNATRAALLETANIGNLELAVLRKEKAPSFFDYIMSSDIFDVKAVNANIIPLTPFPSRKDSNPDILLTDARLEEKTLTIEFEPSLENANSAEITLKHGESKDVLTFVTKTNTPNSIIKALDEEKLQFCSKPTALILKINLNKNSVTSNPRWISTEFLEISPRRRDIQCIKESNGRLGLINMLNQLSRSSSSQEFLLYCLQWINFDDLTANIDWTRRRILQRNTDSENNNGMEIFELEPIDRNEIAKKILDRHQKKFQKALLSLVEDPDEKMPRNMDLYLFIGKITIWFAQTKTSSMEELRWIWSNSEKLVKELRNLWKANPKDIENLVKKTSIIEHMIILAYIITQIHKKEGYASKNPNVVGVFNNTTNLVVRFGYDFGCFRDPETISRQLMTAASEYKEFKDIDLDKDKLFEYFLNLSPKASD